MCQLDNWVHASLNGNLFKEVVYHHRLKESLKKAMLSSLSPFLTQLSRSSSVVESAVADNCRFDERAHLQRWEVFARCLPTDDYPNICWGDWAEAYTLHSQKRLTVPSTSTPDALLEINRPAWLNSLAPEQTLIRLEALEWPLAKLWNIDFTKLVELFQAPRGNADAASALGQLLKEWNGQRDNRPLFAAFLDEMEQEVDSDDWPHQLRNRLGLGHYSPGIGAQIPVALMRYSVQEVLDTQAAHKLPTACASPTALDGGMHEYFFPVPQENSYGATLNLAPGKADQLAAEIIHCRIDYQIKHLWKLGWIEKPHVLEKRDEVTQANLRNARDLHLLQLRVDSEREDFAEEMMGRS